MNTSIITTLSLLALLFVSSCSQRIVYESPQHAATVENALNVNTATAQELEQLPGIGVRTAEAIVQFRTENGPFRRAEHVLQIRGISEKRFNEFRHLIKTE